ncbi:carbohydrate binding-domain-containing protein [Mycena rebaudengoi]|nr:carbohydrate binding-domain-containing protein [Mycena rebaudengoi]
MAPLISVVLTALVASLVAAQEFASCGGSTYDPLQYTCFDGKLLCPIVDGDKYLKCGDACYPTTHYTCINGELSPAGLVPAHDRRARLKANISMLRSLVWPHCIEHNTQRNGFHYSLFEPRRLQVKVHSHL